MAWGDESDNQGALDLFSLGVILVVFAVLVVWGVIAAGGPS